MTMHLAKAEPESTNPPSRILVPLDGSAIAEQALWLAAHLARRRGAILRIVTVHVPDSLVSGADSSEASPTGRETHQALRRYLDRKSVEVAISQGASCECAVLHGWPPQALADDIRRQHVGLVVMTAHGSSGANHRWIGSVTDALLARVRVPVLVLRGDCGPAPAHFFRVLVALDGSPGTARVLDQTLDVISAETGATIALATVVDAGRSPARRREVAAQSLERRAAALKKRGLAVGTHAIVAHGAAQAILELAERLGSDLVVVGTQRPRTKVRLQLGSVADKVVRGAQQPVLVIPVRKRAVRSADHGLMIGGERSSASPRIQRRASRPDHMTVASTSGRKK
jgi:nucleotide-binding universal stress UspA family protein